MDVIPGRYIGYIVIVKSNSSVLGTGPDALFNPLIDPIGTGATIMFIAEETESRGW